MKYAQENIAKKPSAKSTTSLKGINHNRCPACRKNQQLLQRLAANNSRPSLAPPIVHEVLRSPGAPLDRETREFMEPRFGQDFSRVRVHTDRRAAESARAVNALAYTVGQDVIFGEGQYAPGKAGVKQLLAHELTHTIQQSQDQSIAAQAISSLQISNPGDSHEIEAEAQAASLVKGPTTALAPVQGRQLLSPQCKAGLASQGFSARPEGRLQFHRGRSRD
jgi:hypothetical protein